MKGEFCYERKGMIYMLSSLKAFFTGYGTAIDIGGTSLDYHICASQTEANQADAEALAKDWQAVGDAIREVENTHGN